MKTAGILGGMGPQASIRFYQTLIDISQSSFQAKKNHEYPHLLLSNLPVPDLIQDSKHQHITVDMMHQEAKRLEAAGADFLVLACNTMHLFVDESQFNIPFLSMIDIVVQQARKEGRKKVGLLASKTTTQCGLYQEPLRRAGIDCLTLTESQQEQLSNIILNYIANQHSSEDRELLNTFIDQLKSQGAEAIILGCTELPLMILDEQSPLPLYRSLDLLAYKTCEIAYNKSQTLLSKEANSSTKRSLSLTMQPS